MPIILNCPSLTFITLSPLSPLMHCSANITFYDYFCITSYRFFRSLRYATAPTPPCIPVACPMDILHRPRHSLRHHLYKTLYTLIDFHSVPLSILSATSLCLYPISAALPLSVNTKAAVSQDGHLFSSAAAPSALGSGRTSPGLAL